MPIFRLGASVDFPPPEEADESGLLAVGGDLSPRRLLTAYASGVFPWPHEEFPLLWFSPDPRMVLPLDELHVSRRLGRTLKQGRYRVTLDHAFDDVVRNCAQVPRPGDPGTWITVEMREAYGRLHRSGHAHSVETWLEGRLAGGLYGVAIGGVFVGESMYARRPDASKIALVTLVRQLLRWDFELFDAQVYTDHADRMGFREWSRRSYLDALQRLRGGGRPPGPWELDADLAGNGPRPGHRAG